MQCKLCQQNPEYKYGFCRGCLPDPTPKQEVITELAPLIKQFNQSVERLVEATKKFLEQ